MAKAAVGNKLKSFLKTDKTPTRVLGSVERFIISKPSNSDRPTNVMHPSAMAKDDWCYRATYFELLGNPPAPSKYPLSLRMSNVFKNGHDVHDRWQSMFADMGVLYGVWQCKDCHSKNWALSTSEGFESVCSDDCGYNGFTYKEVPLRYDPLRISGHADGWLIGLGEPLLLEVKSMGAGTVRFEKPDLFYKHGGNMDKMWAELDSPFYSHIKQAQIYMKLIELIGLPNPPQEAVFIYENKGTQEVKEFVMAKSDFSVSQLFDAAAMIVAAIDKGTPPACNIDSISGCHSCSFYMEEKNVKGNS